MEKHLVRACIPFLVGFFVSSICSFSKTESKRTRIAPPSYIFGIIWPILYIIIGYAWASEYKNKYVDVIFFINALFSGIWLYMFNCKNNKRLSLYIILIIIATSFMMIHVCNQLNNKILLCLYTTWLLFAMLMNAQLVIIS